MATQTLGQHMLAKILPQDVYRPGEEINKKSINTILGKLAKDHPEEYKQRLHELVQLGKRVATSTGGSSFTVSNLRTPPKAAARRQVMREQIGKLLMELPPEKQNAAIVALLQEAARTDKDLTYEEAQAEGNPLADILKGAGRGNPAGLARLISSDLMYAGSDGKPIPIPVLNSYSQGLSPGEYIAGAFGARKGISEAKLNVAAGGYMSKMIQSAAHRMVVTDNDAPEGEEDTNAMRGLPVETTDEDNVGSLLAKDIGPYKRNTQLTPKILAHLDKLGHDEILVRSPITTADRNGGVYARDVGYRDNGLPETGSSVGITAASAVSEPITQAALSSKHKGGLAEEDKGLSGFDLIDKLLNTPKDFREAAAYAEVDGKISRIEKAPQGGQYIYVGDEHYYAGPDKKLKVKVGDDVEAGDALSSGPMNPRLVVKHKGLGEGARALTMGIREAIRDSGTNANRRNIELVMRGLVDRVRVTKEFDDFSPDEVVPYNQIAANWLPREGHRISGLQSVAGRYLEQPVMHYTVGTRITPSVVSRLQKHGINKITTHAEPPPFQSEMVRASDILKTDRDWQSRQLGTGLQKGLLDATHKGLESDERGTSFVAGRARAVDFNRTGLVKLNTPLTANNLGHQ